jgi:hypothetical protein
MDLGRPIGWRLTIFTRPGKHGKLTKIARNSGFTHWFNGDIPYLCKRLPEGNLDYVC